MLSQDADRQDQTTDSAHAHHVKTVGEITVEHAVAILANGTRAALHALGGDNPDHRLATLAAFLFHLCQVEPERRDKMRALLGAVADEVCHAE
ncbi:MAG: hypothetical protein M0Z28_21060 [Rhodospirillales bacterium]|nr:hypothetical protein [Rhodospirillales bacterium]